MRSSIKQLSCYLSIRLFVLVGLLAVVPTPTALAQYDWNYESDNPTSGQNYRELRTLADAESIYGAGNVPYFVKHDLKLILEDPSVDSGILKVVVGAGSFVSLPSDAEDALVVDIPTRIIGQHRDSTTIQATIGAIAYLGIEKVTLTGNQISFFGDGSTGYVSGGGFIRDSRITDWGGIAYNANESFEAVDNEFVEILNPTAFWAVPFFPGTTPTVTFDRNLFRNMAVAFIAKEGVDAGLGGADFGYNVFENVGTVLINQEAGVNQNFSGNYWLAPSAKSSQKSVQLLTEESDILSLQIVDSAGAAEIDVSNPLGFNPLADDDFDGLLGYQEHSTHHTDPENPDSDEDGYYDGLEVQFGTDPLNGSDFPTGLPLESFSTLVFVTVAGVVRIAHLRRLL